MGRFIFAIYIENENFPTVNEWIRLIPNTLLFDVKSIFIWFSPFLGASVFYYFFHKKILRTVQNILFLCCLISFILLIFISVLYFPFIKRFVGNDLFAILGGQNASNFWTYIWDYVWGILALILGIFGSFWLFQKFSFPEFALKNKVLLIFTLAIFWFLGVRGNLGLRPLSSLDAHSKWSPNLALLALNPLTIYIESLGSPIVPYEKYISDNALHLLQQNQTKTLQKRIDGTPNICLILLESFGKEVTGLNNAGLESWTPFLDSLTAESIYFQRAYANGTRSMDAIPSIFMGVPSWIDKPLISTDFLNGHKHSLLKIAKEQQYETSFFHGADCESMNFQKFLKSIGLQHYYCQSNVFAPSDACKGTWGIHDHCFLDFFHQQLQQQKQPWLSTFFSLSSHHPYDIPDSFQYLKGEKSSVEQSIRYTDASLKLFFQKIQKEPWYDNTIFILTADHSGKNTHRKYYLSQGMFEVPLLIFSPTYFLPKKYFHLVNHMDIYTTILELLQYKKPYLSFSSGLFDNTERYILNYVGGSYYFTYDGYTLEKREGKFTYLHHEKLDPLHKENLIQTHPELVKKMGDLMHQEIQNYNYRLIHRYWD